MTLWLKERSFSTCAPSKCVSKKKEKRNREIWRVVKEVAIPPRKGPRSSSLSSPLRRQGGLRVLELLPRRKQIRQARSW